MAVTQDFLATKMKLRAELEGESRSLLLLSHFGSFHGCASGPLYVESG